MAPKGTAKKRLALGLVNTALRQNVLKTGLPGEPQPRCRARALRGRTRIAFPTRNKRRTVRTEKGLLRYYAEIINRSPYSPMKSLQITLRSFLVLAAFATAFFAQSKAVAADEADLGQPAGSVAVPEGLSAKEVQGAIIASLIGRQWTVQSKTDERVIGYLKHRSNEATLTLVYDATKIELYCVGWAINKKTGERQKPEQPEGWLKFIRGDIAKNLARSLVNK